MRPISFGRLNVQDAGVAVNLGQSFLTTAMTTADETLVVNSATPFCQDMVPFKMDIDPTLATRETVVVKGISGKTFTIQRGMDGTSASAHGTGAVVAAKFPFAGMDIMHCPNVTTDTYVGKVGMSPPSAGVILQINPTLGFMSRWQFFPPDCVGNQLNLTDYAVDQQISNTGIYITLWQR